MKPIKPPIVTTGPWRSAEPVPPMNKESSWLGGLADFFINIFDAVDLVGILFGFLRIVGHVILVAVRAIFHH